MSPLQRGDLRSALYHAICVERLVHTTLKVAEALHGSGDAQQDASEEDDDGESSPFTILDVKNAATAKDIIADAGLPFGTGCAFYEVLKSESVSKAKLIVVYDEKNKAWLENDDARKAAGLPVGKDGKIAPKAGLRIFVQSTSPNRKIPAGSGLLYKGEAAKQRKPKAAKQKRRRGSDDEEDEGEDEDEAEEEKDDDNDDEEADDDGDDDGDDEEDGESGGAKLPDLVEYGKLSLLSFYNAKGAERSKVVDFMNSCWFTDCFCLTNLGPDEYEFEEESFGITQLIRFAFLPHGSGTPISFLVGLNVEADDYTGFDYTTAQSAVMCYDYTYQWGLQLKGGRKCAGQTTSPNPSVESFGSVPSEIGMIACDLWKLFNSAKSKGSHRIFQGKAAIQNASRARGRDVLKARCVSIYGEKEAQAVISTDFIDQFPYR
eukprot:TRINITY_DN1328_c0_g2_i2.p1 TRINITY_DN1328_c0_g2~~TRINITY_DN1328_c0_g2_i2.p1  ORF type:complete len:432 (+),score=113.17 TRINITY_DN1328_c0_g2_i2:1290-2585(+)